jgi:aryl-alcohol dehydrogenase-like predicted oxidoreductase
MTKRILGKTGFSVTPLGFGSAPVGYLNTERDAAGALLNRLLDRGVNLIDTAASYPGSEELIGEKVSHRRKEFVLVTKVGSQVEEVPDAAPWSAAVMNATVDRALKRMRTDVLDVMLLHSCDIKVLQAGEALAALVKQRDAGKIKHVGYSGDNEAAAYAAGLSDVSVIETSVNLVDQVNVDKVLPLTVKNNIGVLAKRPIANAAWKQLGEQPGMYQSYARTYTERFQMLHVKPDDFGLPANAWAELALRFTLSQPGVHCAIIGTTSPGNLETNVKIADKGPLPKDAADRIRTAFKKADPDAKWNGQT